MTILQRGMNLALVTLMTLTPLTALAQGDAAAETSSGAVPATTVEDTNTTEDAELEAQRISTDGQFRYKQYGEEDDLQIIITEYLGDASDIVVPASLDGHAVIEITGLSSDNKRDAVKSITVSEGIVYLSRSFNSFTLSSYSNLESVTLPATLKSTALTIQDGNLKNIKAPSLCSLSLSGMDDVNDLGFLKGLPQLTSLSLNRLPNVKDWRILTSLTNLKALTLAGNLYDGASPMTQLPDIRSCTQLENLKVSIATLTNIDSIKGLQNLTSVNLMGTQVPASDAYSLIKAPEDMTLRPGETTAITFAPTVYLPNGNYSTAAAPSLVADSSSVVTISGNTLTGAQNGTTTVQLQYEGNNLGKSFTVTCAAATPEPSQPIGDPVNNLPTILSVPGTLTGYDVYSQYDDGTLWDLSGDEPQTIMSNAKYLGAYVYEREGTTSWQLITDSNDTLWSYETTYNAQSTPIKKELVKRVENAVDAVGFNYWNNSPMTAFILDDKHQVWQLNKSGDTSRPQTQCIDTDVKELMKGTESGYFHFSGYLKNNGDLYLYHHSPYFQHDTPVKIASGVTEIIGSYYRGSDGNLYYPMNDFIDTDQSGDPDEWQIYPIDSAGKAYLKSFRAYNWYYIMPDNTTALSKYSDGKTQYTTLLTSPITAAVKGRKTDQDGNFDLLTDGNGQLWEVSTKTTAATLLSDQLVSLGTNGYLLSDGSYYDLNHTLNQTNIKQSLDVCLSNNYTDQQYATYLLGDDGIVYYKGIPLLDHVSDLSEVGSLSMKTVGTIPNRPYFIRTDGTIWTLPTTGELTPYQVCENLGQLLLIGDTNDDGLINASDALQDLRHSVKEIELTGDDFTRGNVNRDEYINASDALQILRYSVKEITEF